MAPAAVAVVAVVVVASHIQRVAYQPEKLLYTVANAARLLKRENRRKEKVWQHTRLTPTLLAGGEKRNKYNTRRAQQTEQKKNMFRRQGQYMTQALRRFRSVSCPNRTCSAHQLGQLVSLRRFHAFVHDFNFPRVVCSLSSSRCLATSSSSFLHAAIILRPHSVTVSTHTSASNALAFQTPMILNARTSLCTQSIHSFSLPPRPFLALSPRNLVLVYECERVFSAGV